MSYSGGISISSCGSRALRALSFWASHTLPATSFSAARDFDGASSAFPSTSPKPVSAAPVIPAATSQRRWILRFRLMTIRWPPVLVRLASRPASPADWKRSVWLSPETNPGAPADAPGDREIGGFRRPFDDEQGVIPPPPPRPQYGWSPKPVQRIGSLHRTRIERRSGQHPIAVRGLRQLIESASAADDAADPDPRARPACLENPTEVPAMIGLGRSE